MADQDKNEAVGLVDRRRVRRDQQKSDEAASLPWTALGTSVSAAWTL